jgi:hypothetical protein
MVCKGEKGPMKKVLSVLVAAGVGLVSVSQAQAAPVAFTGKGSGAILSETVNGAVARFEVFPETQQLSGSLSGSHVYNQPEIAIVNFITLRGTYHASADFVGTINGEPCEAVINQNGTIDFAAETFSGHWVIISSTCGAEGQGTVEGTLSFTGPTTYNVTTEWIGNVTN